MPYARGCCKGCGGEPVVGRVRCKACLVQRRVEEGALRKERRAAKRCLTCGARAKKDRRYCVTHLAYYAARSRSAARYLT